MRRSWVLIVVAGVALAVVTLPAGAIKPPKREKKVVTVAGNRDWTATGLALKPGDRVQIEASGTVKFSNGENDSAVGPEGYDRGSYAANWPYDAAACEDPLPEAGHAALLADVNGERVAIGADGTIQGKEGLLYLGINDCTFTGEWSNTGSFRAIVTIERAVMPVPH